MQHGRCKTAPDGAVVADRKRPAAQISQGNAAFSCQCGEALEFSHSLEAQIGGQIAAGFVIAGFYEDRWDQRSTPLDRYMATSMATWAIASSSETSLRNCTR